MRGFGDVKTEVMITAILVSEGCATGIRMQANIELCVAIKAMRSKIGWGVAGPLA